MENQGYFKSNERNPFGFAVMRSPSAQFRKEIIKKTVAFCIMVQYGAAGKEEHGYGGGDQK